MRRNENLVPQQRARTGQPTGGVDTSLLYEEFRRQFQASKRPVNTDFRALVSWVKVGDQRTHLIHSYPAKLRRSSWRTLPIFLFTLVLCPGWVIECWIPSAALERLPLKQA